MLVRREGWRLPCDRPRGGASTVRGRATGRFSTKGVALLVRRDGWGSQDGPLGGTSIRPHGIVGSHGTSGFATDRGSTFRIGGRNGAWTVDGIVRPASVGPVEIVGGIGTTRLHALKGHTRIVVAVIGVVIAVGIVVVVVVAIAAATARLRSRSHDGS
jgi:hypothetical protein